LRIGLGTVDLNGNQAHPDCVEASMNAAALCELLGLQVEVNQPFCACLPSWSRHTPGHIEDHQSPDQMT